MQVRRSIRKRRILIEDLESRLLLSGVPSYNFGVVANFNTRSTPSNGGQPTGMLIDSAGDIFGTASTGGNQNYGTIYEIAAGTNVLTTVASFTTLTGFHPTGQIVMDSSGNIFGTGEDGGAFGCGTVWELKAGCTTITTLASFAGPDGAYPVGGLTLSGGILYGETYGRSGSQVATVFTLDPNAPVIQDVAIFANQDKPFSTVVVDSSGDIFGTATSGGANSRGYIFEIIAGTSTITTLMSFNGNDGQTPLGNLLMDSSGNLIGATSTGGAHNDGALYSFDPTSGAITVLVSFDGNNGQNPSGNLMFDSAGDIIGTTGNNGPSSGGTLFSFDPTTMSLTTLYSFNTGNNLPRSPDGEMVIDANGDIYGGAFQGGAFTDGAIFELAPAGAPQIPVNLAIVQQPQNSLAGHDFSITVGLEDIFGNLVSADTSSVTLALTTPNNGATLNGTLTEAASGGLATFSDLNLNTAGTYTITATDGNFTKTITKTFTISADPNNNPHLVFAPSPTYLTVGRNPVGGLDVLVEDDFGNVITTNNSRVTIAAQAGLSGTLVEQAAGGVATFSNIAFNAVGNYTLVASDTKVKVSDPDVTDADDSVAVGTIAQAAFTQFPASNAVILAGHPLADSINVSLEDGSGHTVTTDSGTTVTLSILTGPTGGEFYLGGSSHTATLTATDVDGVASFGSVDFDTAGTYTFLATINGVPTVMSKTIVVSPDTDTEHLVFTTEPVDGPAKTALPAMVVKIEDQFGNIFTKDNSRVTVAAVGPGVVSGTPTVNARSGVATFTNLQFATDGNYTLHATDGAITAADSDAFTIGAATQLAFTVEPVNTVAGQTMATIKVTVEDAAGNVVAGDSSAITLALSFFLPGNGATLSGTTTENAVDGVATFSDLSMTTSGNFVLAASDGSLTPGISNFFTITPTAPTHLVIFQQPQDVGANTKMVNPLTGVSTPVIVYVEDQFDNIVTTDSSKVTLTPTPGSTVSNASVNANKGIATFTNFTVNVAGNYTLTASDGALTTDVSDSFAVSTAAKLVFSQGPNTTAAGSAIAPALVVKVENSAGQVVSTDNSAVTITFTQPFDSNLTGTLTVNAVNGIATFSNVIPQNEIYNSLTATDGNLVPAISNNFTVNSASTVTQMVFFQQPGTTVAGVSIAPHVVVRLEDQFGNIVTTSNASVTITVTGPGALTGSVTTNASSGVATFSNLVLKTAGDYTLTATAAALSLSVDSNAFSVVPAAASKMIFTDQPSVNLDTVSAEITLEDQFGNLAANTPTTVTLAIANGPSGASLGGITTAQTVDGIATFNDVMPTLGGNYTLRAFSPNLPSLLSESFIFLLVV